MFTKEEIWDNYTYFIKKVVPVAEEAGVRIGIHPDDPPQPVLAGVPRCIFSNFEGYKKALEIANSPNIGICLCCGSWLEGGKQLTGKDPEEMIRYFGAKKIFKIHFRNVSAPLPHFTETMIDDGYYDMNKIMRALVDVKFEGIVIPDHVPGLGSDPAAEGGKGRRRSRQGTWSGVPAQSGAGLLTRLHELDAACGPGQTRLTSFRRHDVLLDVSVDARIEVRAGGARGDVVEGFGVFHAVLLA